MVRPLRLPPRSRSRLLLTRAPLAWPQCVAYTSLIGMNCSSDLRRAPYAVYDATCRIYDAVLGAAGGPRLDCASQLV